MTKILTELSNDQRQQVLQIFLRTPKIRGMMKDMGWHSPEEATIESIVTDSFRNFMQDTRGQACRDAEITAARRMITLVVADGIMKNNKDLSDAKICERTGLNPKEFSKMKKALENDNVCTLLAKSLEHRSRVSYLTLPGRKGFFETWLASKCISSPCKRDTIAAKDGSSTRIPRLIREQSVHELHREYIRYSNQQHHDWKVPKLRNFQYLVASIPWVRQVRATDRQVCCCVVHSALDLLIDDANKFIQSHHHDCTCDPGDRPRHSPQHLLRPELLGAHIEARAGEPSLELMGG